ncbi:ImmA/IrrE family metallo-endopeptidase [Pediococcus parvulus]|uniref:ImmA/IrrE family metallo-endopeptidase n=1 Tax=Pediococcus parvulus TaxID=54062 RepID=UPI00345E9FB5
MQKNNDELINLTLNYAFDHGVKSQQVTNFTPYMPSFTDTKTETIMINMNWHDPEQLPFQIAHETSHVLNGDKSNQPLYFPTATSKSKIEVAASSRAISILIPYYCKERTEEYADPLQFLNIFKIPGHLYEIVETKMHEYYGLIYPQDEEQ